MKQNTLYSAVANFINSIGPGNTYTSDDFKKALDKETQYLKRSWMGQWYRVRTYQTYLGASGLITKVRKGQWRVNYRIPEWMSLSALETLRGYRDCVYDSRTKGENLAARISGTLDIWVAVDSLPQSPIDMIRQVPEDRLPAFIAELETLIKKYK